MALTKFILITILAAFLSAHEDAQAGSELDAAEAKAWAERQLNGTTGIEYPGLTQDGRECRVSISGTRAGDIYTIYISLGQKLKKG